MDGWIAGGWVGEWLDGWLKWVGLEWMGGWGVDVWTWMDDGSGWEAVWMDDWMVGEWMDEWAGRWLDG